MIAAIKPAGSNTRGLLAYLYGPGRHDEHLDPHIVAGFAILGMPDPGRDEDATLTELARHLDEPVRLRLPGTAPGATPCATANQSIRAASYGPHRQTRSCQDS